MTAKPEKETPVSFVIICLLSFVKGHGYQKQIRKRKTLQISEQKPGAAKARMNVRAKKEYNHRHSARVCDNVASSPRGGA